MFQRNLIYVFVSLFFAACSPLKTSFHDEGHQWELTIHEVQTNLDDLRHDLNCFRAEMQILDGRVRCSETALSSMKQQDLEKQQSKIERINDLVQSLEKKWTLFEKKNGFDREEMGRFVSYTEETSSVLTQFKNRIEELEKEIISQNRRLEVLAKLKGNIEVLTQSLQSQATKSYKVRPGDSLDKIAKMHKTDVVRLKQLNRLNSDLIVVGQELSIPE